MGNTGWKPSRTKSLSVFEFMRDETPHSRLYRVIFILVKMVTFRSLRPSYLNWEEYPLPELMGLRGNFYLAQAWDRKATEFCGIKKSTNQTYRLTHFLNVVFAFQRSFTKTFSPLVSRFSETWVLMSSRQLLRATTPVSSPMVRPARGSPIPWWETQWDKTHSFTDPQNKHQHWSFWSAISQLLTQTMSSLRRAPAYRISSFHFPTVGLWSRKF